MLYFTLVTLVADAFGSDRNQGIDEAPERVNSAARVGSGKMGEEKASNGEDTVEEIRRMGGYGGDVVVVGGFLASDSESESDSYLAAAKIMILWAIQGPTSFAVIYSEEAVHHLVKTLLQLCGAQTTIFLSGELRNDAVLEYFLESALKHFAIGRVEQTQWHPDYRTRRVVLYVIEKKSKRCLGDGSSLNQCC